MRRTLALASAALAAACLLLPVHAQQRPSTGWQAWTWEGNCFAVNYASGSSLPGGTSERAYIAIKHVPKENTFDGVAIVSGLDMPSGAEGLLEVNGQEFPLLVFGNAGFVRSGEPEQQLVEAMAKASEAKVVWTLKDRMETQTYRMEGFQTAKKTIDTACPRPAAPAKAEPAKR